MLHTAAAAPRTPVAMAANKRYNIAPKQTTGVRLSREAFVSATNGNILVFRWLACCWVNDASGEPLCSVGSTSTTTTTTRACSVPQSGLCAMGWHHTRRGLGALRAPKIFWITAKRKSAVTQRAPVTRSIRYRVMSMRRLGAYLAPAAARVDAVGLLGVERGRGGNTR